jgi:hypothetical protein
VTAWAGRRAGLRAWLALLLPLAFVVATAVLALRRENAMIRREVAEETPTGVPTEEDLELVSRVGARRARSLRQLLGGDLDGWLHRRTRHNQLVQLALARVRARTAPGPLRPRVEAEADRLRAALRPGWPHVQPARGAVGTRSEELS